MQPGFWRKCRTAFRWSCRAAFIALLAAVGVIIWFDRVGLPDFLKSRLVQALRDRNIELEFSRLHFSLARGILADNVRIGQSTGADAPSLSAQQVVLEVDYRAAWHRKLQINGLVLRGGSFIFPLSPTNSMALTNIEADLRFQTNDDWSLDHFAAEFSGVNVSVSGKIFHARELPNWPIFHGNASGNAGAARAQLREFSEVLRQIQFTAPPRLTLNVNGDARDIHSFDVRLFATAPAVQSAWADAENFQFTAKLTAPANAPTNFDAAWGFWTNAQPYRLAWLARAGHLKSKAVEAEKISAVGFWNAPVLALTNLSAKLGGGHLKAAAALNVATRELVFTNTSDIDLHAVNAFLTGKTRERLADFAWTRPPQLRAGGSMIFPAWTNLDGDWRELVQPTIQLAGNFSFTNAEIQHVPVDFAAAEFSYSSLIWQIPTFQFAQLKTKIAGSGSEDDATKHYHWKIAGQFDPETLRFFLSATDAGRIFSKFAAAEPIHFSADISGRLYDLDSIAASGHLAATNFAVRMQHVDTLVGNFSYTNRVVTFFDGRLERGAETMTADEVLLDFNEKMVWFKNGYSTADPQVVANAIGPITSQILLPFHFLSPPTAFVNGCVPLDHVEKRGDTDLRFDIVGGAPFETHKFRATRVTGTIHWLGQNLILTNIAAELYGGNGSGFADFDFRVPHEGADYHFWTVFTNIDLHALASDLASPSNHLAGGLSGDVVVTSASTEDWKTVDGYGQAQLRDGVLWDIPVFGIFSTALNQISPGLGNSRATRAVGGFTMTNGVIYSDSLQIDTGGMTRLQYVGTVDLKKNVKARVTAQLLHNVWGVGPVLSTLFMPVTKIFEYQVSGTLDDPKHEPLYVISKLLLMPLHPIQTMEGIFAPEENSTKNTPHKN